MNAAAKISMLLNLSLLGCLLFVLTENKSASPVTSEAGRQHAREVAAFPSVSVLSKPEETKPFKWSQLESADYRTYIKNLRDIGCPEPTLRAIVTSDVEKAYDKLEQKLQEKLDEMDSGSELAQTDSFNSRQALKDQLQKLPDEEVAQIADLLGLKVAADASAAYPISRDRHLLHDNQILIPLVFQNVDLSALNLNSQQIQAVNDLRHNFLDEIGDPNLNPDDPAYRELWQKSQHEADDMLRGTLGVTAFGNYQLSAEQP
jgi:hypothetical protein